MNAEENALIKVLILLIPVPLDKSSKNILDECLKLYVINKTKSKPHSSFLKPLYRTKSIVPGTIPNIIWDIPSELLPLHSAIKMYIRELPGDYRPLYHTVAIALINYYKQHYPEDLLEFFL